MKVGDKVSLSGIVTEIIKNGELGSRYRVKVRACDKPVFLYTEEDEISGTLDIDGNVTVPAKIERITDDEDTGVMINVRIKANDALTHLTVRQSEIGGVTPEPTPEPEKVVLSPEDSSVVMFGTPVSDMQDNLAVLDKQITGTLSKLTSGQLVDAWGEGHFMALKFTADDWSAFESVKVGMDPSYGSGLVEIKDDPDHDGAWKVTETTQKFVIDVDGDRTEYDLSGLVLAE